MSPNLVNKKLKVKKIIMILLMSSFKKLTFYFRIILDMEKIVKCTENSCYAAPSLPYS